MGFRSCRHELRVGYPRAREQDARSAEALTDHAAREWLMRFAQCGQAGMEMEAARGARVA